MLIKTKSENIAQKNIHYMYKLLLRNFLLCRKLGEELKFGGRKKNVIKGEIIFSPERGEEYKEVERVSHHNK